jgi:hypothetical protein
LGGSVRLVSLKLNHRVFCEAGLICFFGVALGFSQCGVTENHRGGAVRVREGSQMTFWEFPFGVEVEAPDSAIQELEELATLAAGPNWGMEFAGTAIHFRFQHKQSGGKFIKACSTRRYLVFIPGTRRYLGR